MKSQAVIFTDLDGTLLDHKTYTFTEALPALQLVTQRGIPLVFCSSKTRAEIEYWRKKLENLHPFISENGGGIFIPVSYFSADQIGAVWPKTEMINEDSVLVLGKPYSLLRTVMQKLRRVGFAIRGFGDMTVAEVAETTGLSLEQAKLAKKREFDETFIFSGNPEEFAELLAFVREEGLRCSQGKFHHLMGDNDKGKAVEILKSLYQRKFGDIVTIGLGDSPVDFPMLEKVDYPILVQNDKGEHHRGITLPNLMRVEGIGPEGWNKAVLMLIQERL
jgi:mannosyl-3-phosphoglycerate phosphatase